MNILLLLLPLGLVLMVLALGFLIWTIRTGHYEDLDSPAYRVLMDDDGDRIPTPQRRRRARKGQQDATMDKEAQQ